MQGLNISNLVSGAQHRAAVGMDPIKNYVNTLPSMEQGS